jgi:hypothetical protein
VRAFRPDVETRARFEAPCPALRDEVHVAIDYARRTDRTAIALAPLYNVDFDMGSIAHIFTVEVPGSIARVARAVAGPHDICAAGQT